MLVQTACSGAPHLVQSLTDRTTFTCAFDDDGLSRPPEFGNKLSGSVSMRCQHRCRIGKLVLLNEVNRSIGSVLKLNEILLEISPVLYKLQSHHKHKGPDVFGAQRLSNASGRFSCPLVNIMHNMPSRHRFARSFVFHSTINPPRRASRCRAVALSLSWSPPCVVCVVWFGFPYVDSCDEPSDPFEPQRLSRVEAEPYSFIADSAALLASFFAERASRFTLYSRRCLWMKAVGECDVRKVEM
jgi:hypothetical protein